MSAALIALLVSAGASVWVFGKMGGTSGHKDALGGSAVVFVLAFIVVFTVAHLLSHN